MKGTTIEEDEVMVSFDVKSLFTSVPTKDAANAIEELFREDTMMEERIGMSLNAFTEHSWS